MWQRVQTLYLGIAVALIGSLFFCDICRIIGPEGSELRVALYEKTPYLIMNIMVFTATAITLFSFKARMLQMRVAILSALLLAGFQIWLGVDFVRFQLIEHSVIYRLPVLFPLVAAVLCIIAWRNIMLDEAMVLATALKKAQSRKKK